MEERRLKASHPMITLDQPPAVVAVALLSRRQKHVAVAVALLSRRQKQVATALLALRFSCK